MLFFHVLKSIIRVLLRHSGLSIWHCPCSSSGHCCGTGSVPDPHIAMGVVKKSQSLNFLSSREVN